MKQLKLLPVALISSVGFIACGGDTTENITKVEKTGMEVVSKISELPNCIKENEGESVLIREDGSIRVCSDGKWYATAVTENTVKPTCSTETLADKSGIKIVCSGDSVGVVKNGVRGNDGASCSVKPMAKDVGMYIVCGNDTLGTVLNGSNGSNGSDGNDGSDGKDGKGCSIDQKVLGIINVTCGDETIVMTVDEKGLIIGVNQEILDPEQIGLNVETLVGYVQKGPFLMGSDVEVIGLDHGKTLELTENAFSGKVVNDRGEFKLNGKIIPSQYVSITASGLYRNEVSGKAENAALQLKAVSDLNIRTSVNVNILTHLEYDRVLNKVQKEGKLVKEAKAEAAKEILDIFHIDASKIGNFEDLNIMASSDGDAALLAVSILLQRNQNVADLQKQLSTIAQAVVEKGSWTDASAKLKIADWAMGADTLGTFATIRANMENWSAGAYIPAFERIIRNYWRAEYGMDECGNSEAVEVGAVVKAAKGGAKADVRFICADVAGDIRWRVANDFEKDTYGWKAGVDGELKEGDVTKKKYVFDAEGVLTENKKAGWRLATDIEKLYGGCNENLFDEYRRFADSKNGRYYQCDESTHQWKLVSSYLPLDTKLWEPGEDGYSNWGSVIGVETNEKPICYVWDDAVNGYRVGTNEDCSLGMMGCTPKRAGEMLKANNGRYYSCANNKWTEVTNDVYVNTYLYRCTESEEGENIYKDGDLVYGIDKTGTQYACDNGKWRETSVKEEQIGKACTEKMQGNIVGLTTCSNKNWRNTIVFDYKVNEKNWFNPDLQYGVLFDKRDGRHYKTIKIGEQVWMAENLNYADSVASPYLKGQNSCYQNDSLNCLKGGRYYTWTAAMNVDHKWRSTHLPNTLISEPHQGICPEGWHIPTQEEWNTLNKKSGGFALQALDNKGWPNATNASGFSALPVCLDITNIEGIGGCSDTRFFSSTSAGSGASVLIIDGSRAYIETMDKSYGISIRCLCDSPDESVCNNSGK